MSLVQPEPVLELNDSDISALQIEALRLCEYHKIRGSFERYQLKKLREINTRLEAGGC